VLRVFFIIPGRPIGWDRTTPTARIIGEGSEARAVASVYDAPEAKQAKAEVARLWRVAARGHQTISGPVRMKIVAIFEPPVSWPRAVQLAAGEARVWHTQKPDIDNIEKLILDSLNKLAWADDGQVCIVEKAKRFGSPARIEVTISTVEQQEDEVTPGQRRLEKRVAIEGWDQVLSTPARRPSPPKTDMPGRMSVEQFRQIKQPSRMPGRKPR
jgi:Holliday junction resolvase RusA-like endonuclease